MTKGGWETLNWHTTKMSHDQISSTVESMAVLHATGLAYRMSAKNSFEHFYPLARRGFISSLSFVD